MVFRILFLLLLFHAPAAWAQVVPGFEYHSVTQLRDTVAGAAQTEARMLGRLLSNRGSYSYVVIRRDRTGEVEVHDRWDDVIVVQEGAGTLVYGGRHVGGRPAQPGEPGAGPGERRGGDIAGGTTQPIAAGDLVIVPAGVPHQVHVGPGRSVTYLVIKVAPEAGSSP